ncbi:GntR family transcriptional regulator [Nesterenkonia aerolata]|uniref:GntR family transcriptional regulator n=1 Tax=Nesterenkonia aerolata TaxID=3074079 RepID=A0ABU2DQF1_9MICC|nr:GntR family transcriptional regulator [Nesterenkonia sp. LY-0111]MDR8018732.1 GntR family transcriptional regulator [Nesterenkonia sp. LY-0111]
MKRPKHTLIRDWVVERIRSGDFVEGQRIPTEKQLMERFGVSRAPVQQAMRTLEQAGVVVRRGGAGTFISSARIHSPLMDFLRLDRDQPEEHGDHKVLRTRVCSASSIPWVTPIFPGDTPIALLTRVKVHTSGRPIVLERAAIDLTIVPEVLEQDLAAMATIPYYNSLGMKLQRAHTQLTAEILPSEDAAVLELDPAIPVIRQFRTLYTSFDRPLEALQMDIHPQHLTLEVNEIAR